MGRHGKSSCKKSSRKHESSSTRCCPSSTSSKRFESSSSCVSKSDRKHHRGYESSRITETSGRGYSEYSDSSEYSRRYGGDCYRDGCRYPINDACLRPVRQPCDPCYNPCDPCCDPCYDPCCKPAGFYGNVGCCKPCITFEVTNITSTQQPSGIYVHQYTIVFKLSGGNYFSSGFCGVCAMICTSGCGGYASYPLFNCGCETTILHRESSSSATAPEIQAYYDDCGCKVKICGTQSPTCSITGMLFETNAQPDGTTTINVMLTNTGTSVITGVTFDIPQPANTSGYVAGTNFAEVNIPGGTVMRFGPVDIPVGNTPVTGDFTLVQDIVGSYQWSGAVQATSCTPNLTLDLTTTRA